MSRAKQVLSSILSEVRMLSEEHVDQLNFTLVKEEEQTTFEPVLIRTISLVAPDGTRFYLSVDKPVR